MHMGKLNNEFSFDIGVQDMKSLQLKKEDTGGRKMYVSLYVSCKHICICDKGDHNKRRFDDDDDNDERSGEEGSEWLIPSLGGINSNQKEILYCIAFIHLYSVSRSIAFQKHSR